MADDTLDEVTATGKRKPGFLDRYRGAKERGQNSGGLFGGVLGPVVAALSPEIYQERGQTSDLVNQVFNEDGALRAVADQNPDLAQSIRETAARPMTVGQHEEFRSALLGMVGKEVARNQASQYQLADVSGYEQAFGQMAAAIPHDNLPEGQVSYEQLEARNVATLIKQAREMAPLDPERSKAIMAEARTKGDKLLDNTRQRMEQLRKGATIDDKNVFNAYSGQQGEIEDVITLLQKDADARGNFRDPSPELVNRAAAALGRAGGLPTSGLQEAATTVAGTAAAATGGAGKGLIVGTAIDLVGLAAGKAMKGKDVQYLIARLQDAHGVNTERYKANRQELIDQGAAVGLHFGAQPGDVSAVLDANYQAAADKFPSIASNPTKDAVDKVEVIKQGLTQEWHDAQDAVTAHSAEASGSLPGARDKYSAAVERANIAHDNLLSFYGDQGLAPPPDLVGADASSAIGAARARRQTRDTLRQQSQARGQRLEALRSFTR